MSRIDIFSLLSMIQNSKENLNVDIMSFAGFCSTRNELADYMLHQFKRLTDNDRKQQIIERARQLAG